MCREHIHRLDTHTVKTYRLLEGIATILTTRVHLAHSIRQRLQWNTTTIVAYRYLVSLDRNLDTLTSTHNKLVDGVIHNLL